MQTYKVSLSFYERFFRSLKNPKDFNWKVRRAFKYLCRNTYASTVAPLLSKKSLGCVAMLHLGRSGSTVLGDLLDQHPDIFWDGEIYLEEYQKCFYSKQMGAVFEPFQIFSRCRPRGGAAYYGFESKVYDQNYMDCSVNEFVDGLSSLNVNKFIFLRRDNLLRVAASSQLAHKKKKFHVWKHEKPEFHTVRLCELEKGLGIKIPLLGQLEQWTADLQKLEHALKGYNFLKLSYENDIQNDPLVALHKVTDFLKLPRLKKPIINLNVSTPFALTSLVEDFDKVQKLLEGTPYEFMLHS